MPVLTNNPLIFHDTDQAVRRLSSGEVVAIPTETVYGLAGLGYDADIIARIYRLKNRPLHNPLILHYAHLEDTLDDVVWTPWAHYLAHHFWPGPITFVLERRAQSRIPLSATGGMHSVAIRVPSHPMIHTVLCQLQSPLAAPSANLSGQLSPTTAEHVAAFLSVPILDGGPCSYGLESTIVDGRSAVPKILRPGALPVEHMMRILADYRRDNSDGEKDVLNEVFVACQPLVQHPIHADHSTQSETILCPGQLSGHYAPEKRLRLNATSIQDDEGLLAFGQPLLGAKHVFQLSLERNLHEAAANLFAGLHDLDQSPCTRIAVMPIPTEGIGCAIADRLSRASFQNE